MNEAGKRRVEDCNLLRQSFLVHHPSLVKSSRRNAVAKQLIFLSLQAGAKKGGNYVETQETFENIEGV
jgi:hypothetical protein